MKKFKKLNVSICVMVAILLICASIPVVNAKAMDENGAISVDETLVNSIRNSKKAHIMRGENVISKVENGAKDYVNFDASSKKYIKTCDVYTIKNTSPCAMGNEVETIVTDIELTNAGQKKMGITTASSGGTLYKNGSCGRITGYLKVWYKNKSFRGIESAKVIKIGGKLSNLKD